MPFALLLLEDEELELRDTELLLDDELLLEDELLLLACW